MNRMNQPEQAHYRKEPVKLIYNPRAGRALASPTLLQEIIMALQALDYLPEVYMTEADGDLKAVLDDALRRLRVNVAHPSNKELRRLLQSCGHAPGTVLVFALPLRGAPSETQASRCAQRKALRRRGGA